MEKYETPKMYVDEIAQEVETFSLSPKNDNADNNLNCWGCDEKFGVSEDGGETVCLGAGYPDC